MSHEKFEKIQSALLKQMKHWKPLRWGWYLLETENLKTFSKSDLKVPRKLPHRQQSSEASFNH